jgi:hypothetical protein
MTPDAAAQAAFILATSAEMGAVQRALATDLPKTIKAPLRINVRGTKTDDRDRVVPIVTDEQVVLLRFAKRHAQGANGRLFAKERPNRSLERASTSAKLDHVTPHALRHAAGQWLLDLGVSIELVSRILGHASTSMTEKVYARVKQDAVGDRILDMIDPKYARAASRSRKSSARKIETITKLPEPRRPDGHEVDGVVKTIDGWAIESGIPKSTLYWRVVTRGVPMKQALVMGSASRRASGNSQMTIRPTAGKLPVNSGTPRPLLALLGDAQPANSSDFQVGQDRLELSANGLRVPLAGYL